MCGVTASVFLKIEENNVFTEPTLMCQYRELGKENSGC